VFPELFRFEDGESSTGTKFVPNWDKLSRNWDNSNSTQGFTKFPKKIRTAWLVCGTIINVASKLRPFGKSKQSLPKLNAVAASPDSEDSFCSASSHWRYRRGRLALL